MDSPARRSQARRDRRTTAASPYSRTPRKHAAGQQQQPASAIPRTSSIRSLFNIISSPFRSSAAPQAPAHDDGNDNDNDGADSDGFISGEESSDGEEESGRGAAGRKGWEANGWDSRPKFQTNEDASHFTAPAEQQHPWAASNPLASFSPRVKPQSTHAHALVQMEAPPTASPSQPRYLAHENGGQSLQRMSRSSTMPSLDHRASGQAARKLLRQAELEAGIAEEPEEQPQASLINSPAPPAGRPFFHPGSIATPPRLPLHASVNGGGAGLTRSTSNLSFLSPSRFSRPLPPNAAVSSSSTAGAGSFSSQPAFSFAARPGTGTPARRRPIYVGPGSGTPGSQRKKTPAMALEFLRAAEAERKEEAGAGTPGKRRRVDGGDEGDEAQVDRELSGLLGASSSSSSASASRSSTPPVTSQSPSSPFTFKASHALPASPAPAPPVAQPPISKYSTLPSRLKHPALVAPSPLRQSTSFLASSPEQPTTGPLGASRLGQQRRVEVSPPKVVDNKRKERTESAKLLLGLIGEDKAKAAPAPPPEPPKPLEPTPEPSGLRNPYQSSGLASPSPRRNPRRSAAAASRSKLAVSISAASPARKEVAKSGKGATALDLIEQDVRAKEASAPPSPSPAGASASAKRQKPSATVLDEDEEMTEAQPFEQLSPLKQGAGPSQPDWANTPPPTVSFAPAPDVGSSSTDVAMDISPVKRTQDLLGSFQSDVFKKSSPAPASPVKAAKPAPFVSPAPPPAPSAQMAPFSAPVPAAAPSFSFSAASTTSSPTPFLPSLSTDPKDVAAKQAKHLLPIFTFVFSSTASALPTTPEQRTAMRQATAADKSSLPKFDLLAAASMASQKAPSAPAPSAPAPVASSGGFNWAAAGMAPPPKPAADVWSCGVCGTKSPLDASKCIACEEPAPKKAAPAASVPSAPAPTAASGGFNWAAAGMAPPPKPAADVWSCGVCGTKSPLDASKCIACEEPAPKKAAPAASVPSAPAPTAASGGFNWAAAGMAPPPKPAADVWSCGVCGTKSPLDASKCIACEEPAPKKAASSTPAPSAPVPAPSSGGFNWAAAGMQAPAKQKGWTCAVCMVPNPAEGAKCVSCESPR